jgi:hypothetical protein
MPMWAVTSATGTSRTTAWVAPLPFLIFGFARGRPLPPHLSDIDRMRNSR